MKLSSFWSQFIKEFKSRNDSPVLLPMLKQSSLSKYDNGVAVLACKNRGVQFFLQTKHQTIEEVFSEWIGQKTTITFISKDKSTKKRQREDLFQKIQREKPNGQIKPRDLQDIFTFENYAVSGSNHIAHAAALAVSENTGSLYNPLFIYGGVGIGKTHLIQAIAHKIIERDSKKKVLYCSSEQFTNDLIESIRGKTTPSFRKKYRYVDALFIDDIQFISGKNYIQEEVYHTFNSIVGRGGQIALTSDRPPSDISKLEDRLRSRFNGGLTIDIQKPDFELRTAILLIKAKLRNISVDIDTAKLIAERINDARELEGRLLRIFAHSLHGNTGISKDFVEEELSKEKKRTASKISAQDVIKKIAAFYNVKPSLLKAKNRKEAISFPRQVAMYVLRNSLRLTYEEIAFILKRKDHTTILHGVDKISKAYMKDMAVKESIDRITGFLK